MEDRSVQSRILHMVEEGKVTPQEALRLLQAVQNAPDDGQSQPEPVVETPDSSELVLDSEIQRWKRWWMVPFWFAVAFLCIGALLVYIAYAAGGFSVWFYLAWLPFLLGLLGLILSWQFQSSPWMYIRITQPEGESPRRIAFGLPLPVSWIGWLIRTFSWAIPSWHDQDIGEMFSVLEQGLQSGDPLVFDVKDDEDGDHVQLYIRP